MKRPPDAFRADSGGPVLLIARITLTGLTAVLVPVYWMNYGPQNFLWLSDIALFLSVYAVWAGSRLANSIVSVGILPLELAWNIDFFVRLFFGIGVVGIADYMFEEQYSLGLRALSLFHVLLPPLWIWLLMKWGYDRKAFRSMILIFWGAVVAAFFLSTPEENINWALLPEAHDWPWPSPGLWLGAMLVGVPTLVFLPMHLVLKRIWGGKTATGSQSSV